MHRQHLYTFAWKIFCIRKSVVCRTHRANPPAPAAVPIYPAQRVQRPGVSWHGLPWYLPRPGSGTACAAVCRVQSVWVRWSVQGHTGGVYSRRPAPPGQSRHHRKNKKRLQKIRSWIFSHQKFFQKQKRPLQRVCVLCYTCLTILEREESVK